MLMLFVSSIITHNGISLSYWLDATKFDSSGDRRLV